MFPLTTQNILLMAAAFAAVMVIFVICIRRELR